MSESQGLQQLVRRFGRRYASGEVIFREGDVGEEIFFLIKGSVRVSTAPRLDLPQAAEAHELVQLKSGEIFGDMAMFDGLPRSATIMALEDVEVLAFKEAELYNHIALYPELAIRLMKLMAKRMRRMDAHTKSVLGHQEYLSLLAQNEDLIS